MRVVAVSMVKNEADVIEAFVLHTAAVADRHLVFDHGSTDGTPAVLHRLRRDGLPLTLLADGRPGYRQAERTTALIRKAAAECDADWVLPLDADEFVQAESPAAFRERLRSFASDRPVWLPMRDYAAHPADDPAEPNPVRRLQHRAGDDHTGKVAVPRLLAADPAVAVGDGNHRLYRRGGELPADPLADLWLAHFPARTVPQAVVKVVHGELRRQADGPRSGFGPHYRPGFDLLCGNPTAALRDGSFYRRGELFAPAAYWGGDLRYPPPVEGSAWALAALLPYLDELAASHGRLTTEPSWWSRLWRRLVRRPAPPAFHDLPLPDSRTDRRLGCDLELLAAREGPDAVRVSLRVRNTGLAVWAAATPDGVGAVRLGVRVRADGRPVQRDLHYHPLPEDVFPGQSVILHVTTPRPAEPAAVLLFDMLVERVAWFGFAGCELPLRQVQARREAA